MLLRIAPVLFVCALVAALWFMSSRLIRLTDEVESAKVQIETQRKYIEDIGALTLVLQKNQQDREAEVKAYGKELDRLAQDNVELRALFDTVIPTDALCGLRSCGKN